MKVDENQKAFNSSVEDDIRNSISKDVNKGKTAVDDGPEGGDGGDKSESDTSKSQAQSDGNKKDVDKDNKKPDNNANSTDEETEAQLFEATVDKILNDELEGDETKRSQAKAIANLAIKTFNGDPVKAAKSYKNLFDQSHAFKTTVRKNPFIEKLINEASQGKTVDENYVKNLLGTATSNADEPTKKNTDTSPDKLTGAELDDFDPDKLTPEELYESGSLDKDKYENASSIDKRDMLEKAKIRHSYKVLPAKMAERSVELAQKKVQEKTEKEKIATAKATNKDRLLSSQRDFVTKFNVDFDANPEHANLYEEIYNKAVRIPDIDDDSGMLVSDDAFEKAAQHVFKQKGISLEPAKVTTTDDSDNGDDPIKSIKSSSADIMRRILGESNGFKGSASKRQKQERKENTGTDFNSRVSNRVDEHMNRSYNTTKMISGVRKTDRKKA